MFTCTFGRNSWRLKCYSDWFVYDHSSFYSVSHFLTYVLTLFLSKHINLLEELKKSIPKANIRHRAIPPLPELSLFFHTKGAHVFTFELFPNINVNHYFNEYPWNFHPICNSNRIIEIAFESELHGIFAFKRNKKKSEPLNYPPLRRTSNSVIPARKSTWRPKVCLVLGNVFFWSGNRRNCKFTSEHLSSHLLIESSVRLAFSIY